MELSSGKVMGLGHQQVMQNARKALLEVALAGYRNRSEPGAELVGGEPRVADDGAHGDGGPARLTECDLSDSVHP